MNLEQLRIEIDSIDNEIMRLFNRRMEAAKAVGLYKKENNIPILNIKRENEILDEVGKKANPEIRCETLELYKALMDVSRWYQQRIIAGEDNSNIKEQLSKAVKKQQKGFNGSKIVYQGVPGSYSSEVADSFSDCTSICVPEFEDVFTAINEGKARYGILPIENSSTGAIVENYDYLQKHGFYIVGEQTIRIKHCLLGLPDAKLSDIKTIFSHPQGLTQCKSFIKGLVNVTAMPYHNTAAGALKVSQDNNKAQAAIASANAAKNYGLEIISDNIMDNDQNYTRFIIISKDLELLKESEKISIVFTLPHQSGSLYRLLAHFSYNRLSLTKIESRPIMGRPFEYAFFVDFTGNLNNGDTKEILERIANETDEFTLLGNYPIY